MGGSPPPKTFPAPSAYGAATSKAVTAVGDPDGGNSAASPYSAPQATVPPPPASTGITMEDLLGTDVVANARGRAANPDDDMLVDGRRPSLYMTT